MLQEGLRYDARKDNVFRPQSSDTRPIARHDGILSQNGHPDNVCYSALFYGAIVLIYFYSLSPFQHCMGKIRAILRPVKPLEFH